MSDVDEILSQRALVAPGYTVVATVHLHVSAPVPMQRPVDNAYVVPGTQLVAGEYPGALPNPGNTAARSKLSQFLDQGISAFIDLTSTEDPLAPYDETLNTLAAERSIDIIYERLTIPDMGVCTPSHMHRVLDTIDAHLADGRSVYVHCWGGVGRTGTVVGCWLVRRGNDGEEALAEVQRLFDTMSEDKVRRHRHEGSPQTEPQRDMVRTWSTHEPVDRRLDRYRGALLGLAVGDALGTTLEFTSPGRFTPISDMIGGGPFNLEPGQWTDDTSMALCLAESLTECGAFDPLDQMQRYVRWWKEGHWSSTGHCFDIGNTTRAALSRFVKNGDPIAGETGDHAAGNGSLMRLAPVPLFFGRNPAGAVRMAGESSRTTHGARTAVDACRYFAALLIGAISGRSKEELLVASFSPVQGLWENEPLHDAVAVVADGSFHRKSPPEIRGGQGYVIDTLEAALWAFASTNDFKSGALAAVNLGGDADTTGAVYGQIAGAYYGVSGIPAEWLSKLALQDDITRLADGLLQRAKHTGSGST